MSVSEKQHRQAVKAAFIEGFGACEKAAARRRAGDEPIDPAEAWRASKAYRALTRGDGGEA